MIGRRGFITGLVSLIAAPAIVRVASIMPVKVMPLFANGEISPLLLRTRLPAVSWRMLNESYGRSPMLEALPWIREDHAEMLVRLRIGRDLAPAWMPD